MILSWSGHAPSSRIRYFAISNEIPRGLRLCSRWAQGMLLASFGTQFESRNWVASGPPGSANAATVSGSSTMTMTPR
jgi:hypothetical protein